VQAVSGGRSSADLQYLKPCQVGTSILFLYHGRQRWEEIIGGASEMRVQEMRVWEARLAAIMHRMCGISR
jgi:hypothetical protein